MTGVDSSVMRTRAFDKNRKQNEAQNTRAEPAHKDVPLVELMDLAFTRVPGESCRRRLGPLLLHLCYTFWALINPSVCWFRLLTATITPKRCSVTRRDNAQAVHKRSFRQLNQVFKYSRIATFVNFIHLLVEQVSFHNLWILAFYWNLLALNAQFISLQNQMRQQTKMDLSGKNCYSLAHSLSQAWPQRKWWQKMVPLTFLWMNLSAKYELDLIQALQIIQSDLAKCSS